VFDAEERAGLAFMQALPSALRDRAQIYAQMYDPAMPPERYHPAAIDT
jgi:hypothetical protein